MLALWGRAEIRDYVDVAALLDRYEPAMLLDLAAAKDPGFTPVSFAGALNAIGRYDPEDWTEAGIAPAEATTIQSRISDWSEELSAS